MRVGIIRGDLPGPIFLADLEPVSRYNPPTEPRGQERYISRPTTTEIEDVLSDSIVGAGAVLAGSNISGTIPLTITLGVDDELLIRLSATPTAFTTATIAAGVYNTLAALIAAVNTALATAGINATCLSNVAGNGVNIESNVKGVNSYIENDVDANSTANPGLGLTSGSVRDMPAASAFITAALPVGGPLDVSVATLNGVGAGTNTNALSLISTTRGTHEAVADAIAPQFVETPVALDSFLVGNIADLLSVNFTPDSRRQPALATGPAIEVVEDDGVTPFAATLPTITTSTLNSPGAGDVTIAGTGLGNPERNETVIKYTGDVVTTISQQVLEAAGGSVSDTAIVIPAALIPGAATTTTFNQVKVRQRVSAVDALA
jgi:hypothetical protein